MSNEQDPSGDDPSLNLDRLRIGSPVVSQMSSNDTTPHSPPISSHSQMSSDIQARILAFQQKRTKAVCGDNSDNEPKNKPLPPLPPLPTEQPKSLSSNDISMAGMIPSPSESIASSPHYPIAARVPSSISPQVMARLPNPLSPKQNGQKPFELSKKPSLSQRRGMKLSMNDITSQSSSNAGSPSTLSPPINLADSTKDQSRTTGELARRLSERKKKHNFKLNLNDQENTTPNTTPNDSSVSPSLSSVSNLNTNTQSQRKTQLQGLFANYSKYVDIKSGSLNFAGKASLHSKGIDFSSGSSFRISLDELEFLDELGHGNYGTVSKVLHKPTGVLMAMKEVRLELDETKFTQILMELEVLHKCDSPYIIDFYGAFFVEGAVYMCMEYMDGGSLDKIYGKDHGVKDEACLAYITECIIRGLKELKDQHNIIHRDVKPTNILVNSLGKVKLCDFGVSGNLVASLARTNIGCQSYMAPERIKSLSPDDATYSVQSDIWSLGLTILEIAAGHYPYPAETYDNIFSQLSAIVDGEPPKLDAKFFSKEAQLFVKSCLNKNPDSRPSYGTLLFHPWLQKHRNIDPHMDKFVTERLKEIEEEKNRKGVSRSNSLNTPINLSKIEDVESLLKNKVKAPALHRGGLPNQIRKFNR